MRAAVLTGDVGAGKSTAARVWASMGAHVISADDIAKAQWSEPDVRSAATRRWGSSIYDADGRPIFAQIARRAFIDDEEREFMNSLIHPRTRSAIESAVARADGWPVVEIPLYFETGGRDWAVCVVYAAAPFALRAERSARRGLDASEIARRERGMLPSEDKMRRSDIVMVNDASLEEWEARAKEVGARVRDILL